MVLQDGAYSYVYGLGLLSPADSTGKQSYFLSDGLGRTRYLAGPNSAGSRFGYDVFGTLWYRTGALATEYLCAGQQFDATRDEAARAPGAAVPAQDEGEQG